MVDAFPSTELDLPSSSYTCCETLSPQHFRLLVFVGVGPAEPDYLAPCFSPLFFSGMGSSVSQAFQAPLETAAQIFLSFCVETYCAN